jgi:hypothetical protein
MQESGIHPGGGGEAAMNSPRNWKWMVPALLSPVFFICGYFASKWRGELAMWSIPIFFACLVMLWASFKNHHAYFSTIETENYTAARMAEITTPETLLFDYARQMHPEAVRLLLQHRKKVWMIRQAPFDSREWADWVLFDAPQVHVDAVIYILTNSTENHVMSKRQLAEGSKKLDPDGEILDREQYEQFCALLGRWLMVTRPFGTQSPPAWIAPWNPETVAKSLGVWHILKEDFPEVEKDGGGAVPEA